MEQILQFDWTNFQPETDKYFLTSEALENSVTEKILQNNFHDPLISSSEDEEQEVINWDEIFSKKKYNERNNHIFVPGFRGCPKYPKLSSLKPNQQTQLLKVICANHSHVLPQKTFPRPTKIDFRLFEELKPLYEQEQKEFIAWAKNLWITEHCVRALRPKPPVELVYEAYFKLNASELQCYPKLYTLAAQIPLEGKNENYNEMVFCEDLIDVNNLDMPEIQYEAIEEKILIVKNCSVPEPCNKHPCRFILPTEKLVSILPKTEIERELAQYALEQGAQYIASESALKCLLTIDQPWHITVCVSEAIDSNGERSNVVVLGNEFSIKKESVLQRTYKAFHHLLEDALVPLSERSRLISQQASSEEESLIFSSMDVQEGLEPSSDDEDNLCIDTGDDLQEGEPQTEELKDNNEKESNANNNENSTNKKNIGPYVCTCKDTIFEVPPPRSYKKWRVRNKVTGERHDIIVHCEHRVRHGTGEIVLEPIPEYQLECGAVSLSRHKVAAIALSLYLRRKASLLKVRIDGSSGEIVTMEKLSSTEWSEKHGEMLPHIADVLHTTLNQLQGLLPGNYILQHDPSHGTNAMLYRPGKSNADSLVLNIDVDAPAPADQSADVKVPPTLCDDLLPIHKHRRILPCAFTPYEDQLPKQPRKAPAKNKTPPRAIKSSAERGRKRRRGRH
ncbi:uncharacterized protein LOC123711494 isoform X1 [Pieris brassicae]|uniref:uncharacterized protein LOC123711494 isoform X1 n=1 Tax=Pieris brassicae TaxID=7116 RepID=UPI001E6609A0|nr:uncharacterized protein LOC123711494 isoform X1 [Pieris brassicae]XP_045520069.1 uncharacterized protein LOC123711494 isoform X1 [Pieris brassicae]